MSVSVLLADHDPISRHVLATQLRTSRSHLVECVDSLVPLERWPRLHEATVVVLSVYSHEDAARVVPELTARGIRVLLVVSGVDRQSVEWALSTGATGCVVKDAEMEGLADAVHAVAGGFLLLSPELLAPQPAVSGTTVLPISPDQPGTALTEREHEVLNLLADGLSTAEAARSLGISPATIKSHVSHALPKLGARNRLEAVLLMRKTLHPVQPVRS